MLKNAKNRKHSVFLVVRTLNDRSCPYGVLFYSKLLLCSLTILNEEYRIFILSFLKTFQITYVKSSTIHVHNKCFNNLDMFL